MRIRRLLLIAHDFPPPASGDSAHATRMARHLPAFGFSLRALTHSIDATRLDDDVLRVRDPALARQPAGRHRTVRLAHRLAAEAAMSAGWHRTVLTSWRRAASRAAGQHRDVLDPELIVATYPPVECLELGLELASRWRVPLVADLRDGLTFEPVEPTLLARHAAARRHYQRIESAVAQRAALVLCAFPGLARHFSSAHGCSSARLLPDSFDPDDYSRLPAVHLGPGRTHLVHTGAFAGSDSRCNARPLFFALEELAREHPAEAAGLRVHQLGPLTPAERSAAAPLLIRRILVDHGPVERSLALAFQRAADLLVLMTSATRTGSATGTLFEYLGAGRPVAALTRGTFAETIVTATRAGWCADPTDESAIIGLLRRLLPADGPRASWRPDQAAITAHSASQRMAELAAILNEIVPT